MVSKSKSATPALVDDNHPAHQLSIGNQDQVSQLSKLHPIILLNQQDETAELVALRTSYKYLFVVNWLYNFRGYVRLSSETFDVDLFELELLNYFPASFHHSDEGSSSISFLDKLKLSLMSTVQNSKLSSLNNFEKLFRLWFGYETPLAGRDREDEIADGQDYGDEEDDPKFDALTITEKFDILFILITYISSYAGFRNWLDKNNIPMEVMRVNALFTEQNATTQDDYVLLFENNRLYKRTVHFNKLVIPKKRKNSPLDPNEHFEPEVFDIQSDIEYELIFKNIYELDEILDDRSSIVVPKALISKLSKKPLVEAIFTNEIRKRRYISNKRKELQLASLLATRKRSSRLEAKEKQRQEELKAQKIQEEYELTLAAQKRVERRRQMKEGEVVDYTSGLTRDERLKLRRLDHESNVPKAEDQLVDLTTPAPENENPPIEATEIAEFPVEVNHTEPVETTIILDTPEPVGQEAATPPQVSVTEKTSDDVVHISSPTVDDTQS